MIEEDDPDVEAFPPPDEEAEEKALQLLQAVEMEMSTSYGTHLCILHDFHLLIWKSIKDIGSSVK